MAEAAPEIAPTEATDTANAANTLTEAARAAQPETFSPQMTNPTPEAAPASRAPEQRTIAGRTFYLTDGVWREEGYTAQTVTQLKRATDTYKSLLSAHMFLNDISSLGSEVILEIDGTWYRMTD
ncbi:MAG: hypothetical protein HYV26_21770 [Candidatus Hydrogenedentes bacterium]|nr:hypothetical protein [Candidatus Hydrogenedentota bacterium]